MSRQIQKNVVYYTEYKSERQTKMKTLKRILALLIIAIMLISLCSCGKSDVKSKDGSAIVMSYGDFTLSEKDYMYILSMFKSMMVEEYNYQFSSYGIQYTEAEILSMKLTEDMTMAEYIKEISTEYAQQMLIYEKLCADAGLSITSQTDLDEISSAISDMEFAYGGEDLFEIELARLGISRTSVERFLRSNYMYNLIFDYRYGENGVAKVSEETVYQKFTENYLRYEGALYAYIDYDTGEPFTFEYTDDEIKAYFDENYVKVRHILYMTMDSSGKKLSDEKIAEKKAMAESALTSITSGEKTMDDLKAQTEDSGYEYTFTYGKMVKAFEEASFEMQVGDVRLVETEYGYHIVEKLEKTETDFLGEVGEDGKTKGGLKEEVLEVMCAAKIREEALAFYETLKNGSVTEIPNKLENADYYIYLEPGLISKNDTTYYSEFINMLQGIEIGAIGEKDFADDATYIMKRLDITKDHITASIYSSLEEDLAFSAAAEYVQSFYDKVEIKQDLLDKFDVVTAPMLDSDLYAIG